MGMEPILGSSRMKSKVVICAIFLFAAGTTVWLLQSIAPGDRPSPWIATASALAFLVAAEGIFLRPRFSYVVGLLSGFLALYWFSRIEFREFPALNSWLTFNLPQASSSYAYDVFLAKLKICCGISIVLSIAWSITRLIPAKWVVRKTPVRERTWPTFAICFVVLILWYGVSASPYRIPLIVDGAAMPELTLLHVEKRGIHFSETAFFVRQDRRLYVQRNSRRLFQYRFVMNDGVGVIAKANLDRALFIAQSLARSDVRTRPAVALRKDNAEGWYVRTTHGVLAYSTEYGTEPPIEIVDLFHDLESFAPSETEMRTVSDICLGFCYDPLAGVGVEYFNNRCRNARCE
jgi:hypothetical protein